MAFGRLAGPRIAPSRRDRGWLRPLPCLVRAVGKAKAITQADMTALLLATRSNVRAAVAALLEHGSPSAFGGDMAKLLEDAHTDAVYLGRAMAGDTAPPEWDDRKFASQVMDGQLDHLDAFVSDLQGERYLGEDGSWDADAIGRRAEMYLGRIVGTGNEAYGLTIDPETMIEWLLSNAENCADCPEIAAGSPYRAEEMPTWPGMCDTACRFNCRCSTQSYSTSDPAGFFIPDLGDEE